MNLVIALGGRVGGDMEPHLKLCPITSPGLPDFSRELLKNMGRPGYEAGYLQVPHAWPQIILLSCGKFVVMYITYVLS